MPCKIYLAHADGEEDRIKVLVEPLQKAGYDPQHPGTVMVGESVIEEASKVLATGCPVVLCGTVNAIGTGWAHRVANAVRAYSGVRLFAVRMDKTAYVEILSLDNRVAEYWKDPAQAIEDLLAALQKYYPLSDSASPTPLTMDAERRYRELALNYCDIIDLANLPEDRHIATRQLELRRLYVPLRVELEKVSDGEIGAEQLEAIEQRRRARRRAAAWSPDDSARVPVGERLAKVRRLVILGDPGAGKSTMLRWIATAYLLRLKQDPDWKDLPDVATLPAEDWLPITIRCRDLDASCVSLDDVLRQTLRKSEIGENESNALRSVLRNRIAEGKGLLLVDGLDEISEPIARANFCQQIERICDANPKAPVIVTSRIVGYREMKYRIGRKFEHVTMADLSPQDKDDFARRWCWLTELPNRRDAAAAALIQDIHSTDRIERLTVNPLLLTTMALIKRKLGKLPRRRVDLYWQAVQVLLNWRSEVDQPIDDDEAIPQLEYLAYAMCQQGDQQLREDQIIELFERMREEYPQIYAVKAHSPGDILRLLERRTGILQETGQVPYHGREVPVYEFRHLTFQEYLAALALVDGRFPGRDKTRTVAENVAPLAGRTETKTDENGQQTTVVSESWREALRLCVSCCNEDIVDAVLLAILNPLPGEEAEATGRSRAILAGLCLADEPNLSQQAAGAVVQRVAEQFRPNNNDIEEDLQVFFKEIASSRWADIALAATYSIYQKGVLAADFRALNASVAIGSIASLSAPKDEKAFDDWVTKCIQEIDSGDEDLAAKAGMAFSTVLMDRRTFPRIPDVAKALFIRIVKAPAREVASGLALAVASLRIQEKTELLSEAQMQQLIEVANNSNTNKLLIGLTCLCLSQLRYPPATQLLIAKLSHAHLFVRLAAAEALGDMGDPIAAEALLSLLNDNEMQEVALTSLGKLKYSGPFHPASEQALEPLLSGLKDNKALVRESCIQVLGKMNYLGAVPALLSRLQDREEPAAIREAAAEALGRIGTVGAVVPLIDCLRDKDFSVQIAASDALVSLGSAAIGPLIPLLEEPFETIATYYAMQTLTKIGESAVQPLIRALETGVGKVRERAARVLGYMRAQRAIPSLIPHLDAADWNLRWEAARALGRIGGAEVRQVLEQRLSANFSFIRPAYMQALLPEMDEIDRKLLTYNLDEANLVDPDSEIGETRVLEASVKLGLSDEVIRRRYEELAGKFSLKLAWVRAEEIGARQSA